MKSEINREKLIEKAREAKEFTYYPHSGFKVGTTLLLTTGDHSWLDVHPFRKYPDVPLWINQNK